MKKIKYNIPTLTTKQVTDSLFVRFHNNRYLISNAFIFDWESDFFCVSEAGYFYEIEVKINKKDYKDDFEKKDKHMLLESQNITKKIPNKFFYAFPKNVIPSFEIPPYAGLIEVDPYTKMAEITRDAPFLHKEYLLADYKDILLEKFYWRYMNTRLTNYQMSQKIKEWEDKMKSLKSILKKNAS